VLSQQSNVLGQRAYSSPKKNMDLLKELREKTGAPIGDIKKCLEASNWDLNLAFEALRKKGLATAAKKASRHAAEGLVGFRAAGNRVAVVEVNSETDFVARNDRFRALVGQVLDASLKLEPQGADGAVNMDQLLSSPSESGSDLKISDRCAEVAATVGENVRIRRAFVVQSDGVIGTYVHQSSAPEMGRIVSAVVLEADGAISDSSRLAIAEASANFAMHAAGMRPQYLNAADVPTDVVEKERSLLLAQTEGSGKPAAVVAKMVDGRLNKYYEEVCLVNQKYILDDTLTIDKAVKKVGKDAGAVGLKIAKFLRIQVGEGLEVVATKDFASEVAEMVGGSK